MIISHSCVLTTICFSKYKVKSRTIWSMWKGWTICRLWGLRRCRNKWWSTLLCFMVPRFSNMLDSIVNGNSLEDVVDLDLYMIARKENQYFLKKYNQ